MAELNRIIQSLQPSATLAVVAKASELRAAGKTILGLNAGEPDIDTPEHIKEAAIKAMKEGKTKYTPVPGIAELRAAIAEKFTSENGISATADTVAITNGGKQALYEALQVILNPGDEVIVIAPYWVSYPPMIELAGATAVFVSTSIDDDFKVSPERLQQALTPKTRAVIFNSPSNPSGATYTRGELVALGEALAEHDCWIVSDEVYEKLVYEGEYTSFAAACPNLEARTITVCAFSKTYSMTGWRVGYATGPKEIISGMNRLRSQSTSNVCSIAQYAALGAVTGSHDFLPPLIEEYKKRFGIALEGLSGTPGLKVPAMPAGAFYLFVDIEEFLRQSGMSGSVECSSWLLEDAGVAVVPGLAFGDDNAFRISVSVATETVEQGVQKIRESFEKRLG